MIKLWEISSGKCLHNLEGHSDPVNSVYLTANGRLAISGSDDKSIIIWRFIWDLEFPDIVDWNEGVRPYLYMFLRKHDGEWERKQLLSLLYDLATQYGYGWVKPRGILDELEKMAAKYNKDKK